MLSVEGFYDGEFVRITEDGDFKKNQRVIVTFAEDFANKKVSDSDNKEKDAFMEALLTDKYVSSVATNYDVDAFIRESRGYE